ncbi:ferredoxin [Desulfonema ishimotonii]|uniref:Ferredoxin n=1 Tax=Desulfonema ishimotonii TaxID=45657 RepID=A0A401FRR6_9BACT|nr:4Fe-4S dicluster domain-containing protein [Desulfonema ishimotonii]GBC59662.1 ferredoxin [Desulfonema ishimotonii]
MAYPVIHDDRCVGCENCVDTCPEDVFEMEGIKAKVVHPSYCTGMGCGSCVEVCEEKAIEMVE